jgi:AraC-like DNA-binding protein
MVSVRTKTTRLTELNWLAEVREFAPPLALDSPIWMREVQTNLEVAMPWGEKHPCCEIGFILEGEGIAFIEGEEARFTSGDLLLIGPGVPHSVQLNQYPHRELTVFFMPAVLLEMGPLGDGARLLRRFTMRQKIGQRLIRLPADYQSRFEDLIREMRTDFHSRPLGWEMRLRSRLTELLVDIVQWEQGQGNATPDIKGNEDWAKLEPALAYIRRNFAEPIYATDLARATAMSETRLKNLFGQTLGMPWTKFLQGYRVRQAATQLCLPGQSVTEVAMSAGFQSMSHFIRVFRKFTGTAPSVYAKNQRPLSNMAPHTNPCIQTHARFPH